MANFHVEFGINETQLTRLLERGEYREAERLIQENNSASYLDEGCYQRTPLFIVLSGEDETGQVHTQRNLHLAKLLVEHGACVNYRIPITDGAEYVSPGSTALELVVEFFVSLCHWESVSDGQAHLDHRVIGVDNAVLRSAGDVKNDLLDLMFIMLSNGGDTSIRDEQGQTLLHRAINLTDGNDLRLVHLLVESNADLNSTDHKGNTPLLALCERRQDWWSSLDWTCDMLSYLVSQETIQLDKENRNGRTALFSCVIRGNISGASLLLQNGADPTKKGKVNPICDVITEYSESLHVSPVFAFMCSPRALRSNSQTGYKSLTSPIAHLVDCGFFSTADITHEIHCFLAEDFQDFDHLKRFGNKLVNLMFGGTSASLRQLCVRNIFHQCLARRSGGTLGILGVTDNHGASCDAVTYWSHLIDSACLERLIAGLSLPADSLIYFEVELFVKQLCSKLCSFRYPVKPDDDFCDVFSETDELSSSEEGESDIEYW